MFPTRVFFSRSPYGLMAFPSYAPGRQSMPNGGCRRLCSFLYHLHPTGKDCQHLKTKRATGVHGVGARLAAAAWESSGPGIKAFQDASTLPREGKRVEDETLCRPGFALGRLGGGAKTASAAMLCRRAGDLDLPAPPNHALSHHEIS